MTVPVPASICAMVPKNTRASDSTSSTTVTRREATGARALRSQGGSTGWCRAGGAAGAGGGGRGLACGAAWIEVLLIGGSSAGEADGLDERLEGGFLFLEQLGRPLHRER